MSMCSPLSTPPPDAHERAVERQVAARRARVHPAWIDRLAGVEVDRRAADRQRVDLLRAQRGPDRRQPAALAVADEVHSAAEVLHRAVDHLDVVLDRRVACVSARRADPVQLNTRVQPGVADLAIWLCSAGSRRCRSRGRPGAAARASGRRGPRGPGRSRAGARSRRSKTTSFGVVQLGRRRPETALHQSCTSSATVSGVAPRACARIQYSDMPSTAAVQASNASSTSAGPTGAQLVITRDLPLRENREGMVTVATSACRQSGRTAVDGRGRKRGRTAAAVGSWRGGTS